MKSLLKTLTTGSKVNIQTKERRLYIPEGDDEENPKNPEVSLHESPIKEISYCWGDVFRDIRLVIFGNWDNRSDLYGARVYDTDWISESEGLLIIELPDYKYLNRIMKNYYKQDMKFREFYNIHESQFAKYIARAIDGRIPEQLEIEHFRRSKPYFDHGLAIKI